MEPIRKQSVVSIKHHVTPRQRLAPFLMPTDVITCQWRLYFGPEIRGIFSCICRCKHLGRYINHTIIDLGVLLSHCSFSSLMMNFQEVRFTSYRTLMWTDSDLPLFINSLWTNMWRFFGSVFEQHFKLDFIGSVWDISKLTSTLASKSLYTDYNLYPTSNHLACGNDEWYEWGRWMVVYQVCIPPIASDELLQTFPDDG